MLFVSLQTNEHLSNLPEMLYTYPTDFISLISNLVCFNGGKSLVLPSVTVTSSSWLLACERWLL